MVRSLDPFASRNTKRSPQGNSPRSSRNRPQPNPSVLAPLEGTPMAPPSAAPQWVVLRRSPRTSMDLPEGADIALELAAPPRPSELLVPPSLGARGSGVLAADPSGILLLSSSCGTDPLAATEPASVSYHLCDTVFKASSHVPVPERPPVDDDTGVAGLVISDNDNNIMVAELSICDNAATLRCFSMETSMWTTHENLRSPPSIKRRQWCSAYALSYRGRLWWVDLLQGLVACDPFADNPELHFVSLPSCYRRILLAARREGLSKHRCVSLSCEKLRLVVMNRRISDSETRIKLWTLADYEAGKWTLDFDVRIQDIWDHQSYNQITGLPMERPVLAFVHPNNAHVVYFFLQQKLFAVDLQTAKVTESENSGRDDGQHFLAWELPSSLRTSGSYSVDI